MPHLISGENKKELDNHIEAMAGAFCELVDKLKELKINPNIEWVQTLHTILDTGVSGVSQLAFFDRDRSYTSWASRRLEVCEDEDVVFEVTMDSDKQEATGTFNRASGKVDIHSFMINDTEIDSIEINFEYDGETYKVCTDCMEGVIKNDTCTNCG